MLTGAELFLVQALLVICLPYLLWRLLPRRAGIPLVAVQILAGIALGPSLLGHVAPDLWPGLFGAAATAPLGGLSRLAVVLFAFLTGLHLESRALLRQSGTVLGIAGGSLVLSGLLGIALGAALSVLLPELRGGTGPWTFAAAVGICSAVTALPVLGAIVRSMDLMDHVVGRVALAVAAISDAVLWILLAALLATADGHGRFAWHVSALLGVAYLAVMVGMVRPLLARVLARPGLSAETQLIAAVLLMAVSALATEIIGLHYVLGAFVAGLIVPRPVAAALVARIEPATLVLLMPFFFLDVGMRTGIGALGTTELLVAVAATVTTVIGKVVGSLWPARRGGLSWRESLAIGALLQTKGLMEVIVLTTLLQAGIITASLFTGLLLMALFTTLLAQSLAGRALALGGGGRAPGDLGTAGR